MSPPPPIAISDLGQEDWEEVSNFLVDPASPPHDSLLSNYDRVRRASLSQAASDISSHSQPEASTIASHIIGAGTGELVSGRAPNLSSLDPAISATASTDTSADVIPQAANKQAAQKPSSTSSSSTVLVLSGSDVSKVLDTITLDELLANQADAFRVFAGHSPDNQTPNRVALQLPNHTALFMPSCASQVGGAACKIVSVPSGDGDVAGLPGATVVLDETTGRTKGFVNSSQLTGARTAAGSAVASRALVPAHCKTPEKLIVFGSGVQAFWHTKLHLDLFPSINHLVILARPSSSPTERTKKLVERLQLLYPNVQIEHSSQEGFDRGQAVHNADIILCCTPSTEPLFPATQPRAGTHISLIGSYKPHMIEVEPELVRTRVGVLFVDGEQECRVEAGELQGYEGMVRELGSVLDKGTAVGEWKKAGGDLTIFKSVGLAIQDVAITSFILEKGRAMGLGTEVDF